MDIKVTFKDGTTAMHNNMIFVGEIAQTNELVVGNGFNTTLYDLDTVDSFTGNINSVNRAMERKRFVTNTINHLG